MKAEVIISGDFYDHDERKLIGEALRIGEWMAFVWEFAQYLRSREKYGDDPTISEVREEFYRQLNDRRLSLE